MAGIVTINFIDMDDTVSPGGTCSRAAEACYRRWRGLTSDPRRRARATQAGGAAELCRATKPRAIRQNPTLAA